METTLFLEIHSGSSVSGLLSGALPPFSTCKFGGVEGFKLTYLLETSHLSLLLHTTDQQHVLSKR